ncbi:MAG: PqqD family protein [Clostridia bacterium]|nr:PqqD family protein [Clostridia bacterium]
MKSQKNYLDKIPEKNKDIKWKKDENGVVTLEIKNKGVMKRITQILFKKPKVSYVHFDETGSFVWPIIDGIKDIWTIGKELEEEFGEKAHPLYERLAKYFQILESYGFITLKDMRGDENEN